MYCENCGTKNEDSARFCENCGTEMPATTTAEYIPPVQNPAPAAPVYSIPVQYVRPVQPGKGFAIAGMVCGIIALCLLSYSIILGILGIVFGAVAKRKGFTGGMATAGIVCGTISLVLFFFIFVIILSVVGMRF